MYQKVMEVATMENISDAVRMSGRMLICVKFTLFFLLISLPYLYLSVDTHEQVHQAIFTSFNISSTRSLTIASGYTWFDNNLCPNGSQCMRTQQAIEDLKPKVDGEFIRVVLVGFLIILASEIAFALIKYRREVNKYG